MSDELTDCKSKCDQLKAELNCLKAKIKRLIKAGNAMEKMLDCPAFGCFVNELKNWRSAKKGKDL